MSLTPDEIKHTATRIIAEGRVPTEVLYDEIIGDRLLIDDLVHPHDIRDYAESLVGEDRIPTDVLVDLIESYDIDEDRDRSD